MKTKIRTAFIFDPATNSPLKDQAESAIMELDAAAGLMGDQHLPIERTALAHALNSGLLKRRFDLMIIDYGGASTWGGNATGSMQVDAACRYAENHPGCLLIIWTGYTANIYQDELKESFGHLDNVICRYIDSSNVYKNLDGSPEFIAKVTSWFEEEIEQAKRASRINHAIPKIDLQVPGRKARSKARVKK